MQRTSASTSVALKADPDPEMTEGAMYEVINLETGESHGKYESRRLAQMCVAFDELDSFQIWHGDMCVAERPYSRGANTVRHQQGRGQATTTYRDAIIPTAAARFTDWPDDGRFYINVSRSDDSHLAAPYESCVYPTVDEAAEEAPEDDSYIGTLMVQPGKKPLWLDLSLHADELRMELAERMLEDAA